MPFVLKSLTDKRDIRSKKLRNLATYHSKFQTAIIKFESVITWADQYSKLVYSLTTMLTLFTQTIYSTKTLKDRFSPYKIQERTEITFKKLDTNKDGKTMVFC